MYDIPNLLFADRQGNIYDHPHLKMTVRSENYNFVPYEIELIELPPPAPDSISSLRRTLTLITLTRQAWKYSPAATP